MKENEKELKMKSMRTIVDRCRGVALPNAIGKVNEFGFTLYGKATTSLRRNSGQGTTEYAILVGVLVVIAILAITIFRPKIQELWDAISAGINGL